MFTGLIQNVGRIKSLLKSGGSGALVIEAQGWDRPLGVGESIAVQGVCLTVTAINGDELTFDVLGETFRCTNLGDKGAGDLVNLERALRQGDPLGGHMVQGHVDGVGQVQEILPIDRDHRVEIHCAPEILKYVVFKGSVAVDGISLTIAAVDDKGFTVHIIPHTWEVTTFGRMAVGDAVNLEADPLAKYVEKALLHRQPLLPINWAAVQQGGYDVVVGGSTGPSERD
jgi:riboflavin synthase